MDRDLLEKVLNVSRKMAAIRNLDPLLDYVLTEAMTLVGAEQGFVVLVTEDETLDFRVKRQQDGLEVENAEDQISKSILNQTIETGEPILTYDAKTDPNFNQAESVALLGLRSIMCVPLTSRGDSIGAIYVENRTVRGHFEEENLSPLIIFANQAAVSIENATLNDDLEKRVSDRTQQLEQAKEEIEENWTQAIHNSHQRKIWLNQVTHDLSTPLAIATGWLMLLQSDEDQLSQEHRDWLANAISSVEHTVKLINDFFALSKIDVGGLALRPEPVDLKPYLQKIYEVGQGLGWGDQVEFLIDMKTELPKVPLDPLRIQQVLLNLLSNAHKFTNSGTVTLHAQYKPENEEVLLGVMDTGEGIPLDKIDQLFDRFHQGDDQNLARKRKGSGLGLAICRELVEMHHGKIWVESIYEIGSNFIFTLPLNPPEPVDDEE